MTSYLVNRDGQLVIELRTNAPESFIGEVPSELSGEFPDVIEFVTELDSEGFKRNVCRVNQEKKTSKEAEKLNAQLEAQIQQEIEISEGEIISALLLDDNVAKDKLKQRHLFRGFAEYRKEDDKQRGVMKLILRTQKGYEIKEVPHGTRPSNVVCAAPHGFGPEDIEFVQITELDKGVQLKIDWEARLNKFKATEISAEEAKKKDEWNRKSALERLKHAILPGDQ